MKQLLAAALFLPFFHAAKAQIGIGTPNPVASAKLQVDDPNKGFLPPRVALKGTDDATKSTPTIASPAPGLLVYNTANVTGATGVTPGYYFYDGSKWQRLINQQPDATVEFTSPDNDPSNVGTTFHDGTGAQTNVIYVSRGNGSQWTYSGMTYVTYTAPASTAWYTAGGTTDAGSNKTGSVYRSGKVGIGGSNTPNATLDVRTSPTSTSDPGAGYIGVGTTAVSGDVAGAGAIRYNPNTDGGRLQYSNGTATWNTLTATVQKTVVTGFFSGTYNRGGEQKLIGTETSDATNAFDGTNFVFTAPRTGLYLVTANLLTTSRSWTAGEELNITFAVGNDVSSLSPQIISSNFIQAAVTTFQGTTISAVVQINVNQKAQFNVFNAGSGTLTLYNNNYNRFSITEL